MHKLAIVGFGGMGGWHQESIAEHVPGIQVKGIWDIREEARDKAREKGLHVYGSFEEVLADEEIDIVTIATPNDVHRDLAIASLRAGKVTISEKPVTIHVPELEDIIAVAKETGVLFSVHQNRRWDKDYLIVKRIIDENLLGEPYFIESKVQGSKQSLHGWRGHKLNGGGMVLDWGVHLIDQVMDLFKCPVVGVHAHLFSMFTPEVEDNIKIFLRFENNVSVMLEMATNCFINQPRWHISCKEGTAVIEDWSCAGKMIQLSSDKQMVWDEDIVYTAAGPTRTMAPRPPSTTRELPLPEVNADWSEYYKNILDVMDNNADLIVKPEQALRVMKVIEAIFQSEEDGQSIKCRI